VCERPQRGLTSLGSAFAKTALDFRMRLW
jgi:hypothetical protein